MAKSSAPKRHRSVDVLGTPVKIRYRKGLECEEGEEMDGLFIPQDLTIILNTDRKDIPDILLHEFLHGVFLISGVHNLITIEIEEAIIDATVSALKGKVDLFKK